MIIDEKVNAFLEHHGVKGQKWGVRRNKKTGVRPIAKTISKGPIGKANKANVKRHNNSIAKKRNAQRNVLRAHAIARSVAGALFVASILASGSSSRTLSTVSSSTRKSSTKKSVNIDPNIIRAQEAQRNGAFQVRKMLKEMGEDVI